MKKYKYRIKYCGEYNYYILQRRHKYWIWFTFCHNKEFSYDCDWVSPVLFKTKDIAMKELINQAKKDDETFRRINEEDKNTFVITDTELQEKFPEYFV